LLAAEKIPLKSIGMMYDGLYVQYITHDDENAANGFRKLQDAE
jgi:hypothetical protein